MLFLDIEQNLRDKKGKEVQNIRLLYSNRASTKRGTARTYIIMDGP